MVRRCLLKQFLHPKQQQSYDNYQCFDIGKRLFYYFWEAFVLEHMRMRTYKMREREILLLVWVELPPSSQFYFRLND